MKFNAIALFCEDIRDEANSQNSLVGVLPDNVQIPVHEGEGGVLPKLGIYCRIHVPIDQPPEEIQVILAIGSDEQQLSLLNEEFVGNAIKEALSNKSPIAGLITRMVSTPFPIPASTRLVVIVRTKSRSVEAAALNVILTPAANDR